MMSFVKRSPVIFSQPRMIPHYLTFPSTYHYEKKFFRIPKDPVVNYWGRCLNF